MLVTRHGRQTPDTTRSAKAAARLLPRGLVRASTLALCVLLAGAAMGLAVPAAARAGTWTLVSCSQPDGEVAPTDGWTSVQIGGQQNYSGDTDSCGQSGGGLFATSSSAWPQTRGDGWMWQFNAPAGATIAGGSVDVMLTSPVGQAFVLTPNFNYDGADVVINCQFNLPCGTGGVLSGAFPIDHPGGTSLYAGVMCLGPGQPGSATADCPAGGGTNGVNVQLAIYSAQIELNSNATPTATAFSGSLLSPDAHGTADLAFTASDPGGPGIYQVTVEIDGNPVYRGTPDSNQGDCTSIGSDPNGYPEFLYAQPCKQTETVDIPVDTSALADGEHDLKVIVTDVAQDSSTVLDQTITTLNRTTVSSLLPSSASTSSQPVYSIALAAATKRLTSGVRRPYSRSAMQLAGTLEDSSGVAAPGIAVTLWAQPASGGRFAELARTTTDASGAWALSAPRGSSRVLRILAGSGAKVASAAGSVSVHETVTPALSLHVGTPGGGRIVFTGRLGIAPLGDPRPLVFIQTRGPDGWEVVGSPVRVNASGDFRYVFRSSSPTLGRRFSFRALTPQTTFWQPGQSAIRSAVVH
jgi:hypothetical protein